MRLFKKTPIDQVGARKFLTKSVIYDFTDPTRPYLTRYIPFRFKKFGIFIHKIELPDSDRHLHDHPWPFLAFIVKGGYTELFNEFPSEPWRVRRRHHGFCSATESDSQTLTPS